MKRFVLQGGRVKTVFCFIGGTAASLPAKRIIKNAPGYEARFHPGVGKGRRRRAGPRKAAPAEKRM